MSDMAQLLDLLAETATTLERWANESERGGWSTHQVQPQRELAARLWAAIGRARVAATGPRDE